MNATAILVLVFSAIIVPLVLVVTLVSLGIKRQRKILRTTQSTITDRDLLRLIAEQPDGILSVKQLAEKTGLTKAEAKTRLSALSAYGVLKSFYGSSFKSYYSLYQSLDERTPPRLSEEPFLTVEDVLALFKHFNFRLSPQQLILATGLPLNVIKREMKYFQAQKIIQVLTSTSSIDGHGEVSTKTFILQEPYRSNPEQFSEQKLDLNRQVEIILQNEDLV